MNLGDRAVKNELKVSPVTIKWNHVVLSLQKLVDILSLKRNQARAEEDINDVTAAQVILPSTFLKNSMLLKYVNMIKYDQWQRKRLIKALYSK